MPGLHLCHCSHLKARLSTGKGQKFPCSLVQGHTARPLCFLGWEEVSASQGPWLLGTSGQPVTGGWKRSCLGACQAVVLGTMSGNGPGACSTHLARSWLGTEDLDGVMSLDEDIRSSTGNQESTRWIQHLEHICSTARCQALF